MNGQDINEIYLIQLNFFLSVHTGNLGYRSFSALTRRKIALGHVEIFRLLL